MKNSTRKILAGNLDAICISTKVIALLGAGPAVLPLIAEAAREMLRPDPEETDSKKEETNSKVDEVISELATLKQTNPEEFEKIIASLKKFRL